MKLTKELFVISNKNDYISRMNTVLKNNTKFVALGYVITFDSTVKTKHVFQLKLKSGLTKRNLSEDAYELVRPTGSNIQIVRVSSNP